MGIKYDSIDIVFGIVFGIELWFRGVVIIINLGKC